MGFPERLRKVCADRFNGALKSGEVTLWFEADHAAAFRTPVAPKKNGADAFIKPCGYEPMPPQSLPFASGALRWPRPWIIFTFNQNLLEHGDNSDYHDLSFWGYFARCPVSGRLSSAKLTARLQKKWPLH
jgi:hypothetical protein